MENENKILKKNLEEIQDRLRKMPSPEKLREQETITDSLQSASNTL